MQTLGRALLVGAARRVKGRRMQSFVGSLPPPKSGCISRNRCVATAEEDPHVGEQHRPHAIPINCYLTPSSPVLLDAGFRRPIQRASSNGFLWLFPTKAG